MENNNIKWEAGDIAICKIVGHLPENKNPGIAPPLRLNCEYIVQSVRICECGDITLDVGLHSNGEKGTVCVCGAVASSNTGIHWANARRFVKKRTAQEVKAELNAAIEDEEFKVAQELQIELDGLNQR